MTNSNSVNGDTLLVHAGMRIPVSQVFARIDLLDYVMEVLAGTDMDIWKGARLDDMPVNTVHNALFDYRHHYLSMSEGKGMHSELDLSDDVVGALKSLIRVYFAIGGPSYHAQDKPD